MTTDLIAPQKGRQYKESPLHTLPTDIAGVRAAVTDLERQARELIHERPVLTVMIAAGVGYLLARIVVRGSR